MSLRIAVVGLGFGDVFVPAYRDHPDVDEVFPVDVNEQRLRETCEKYGLSSRFLSFDEAVASPEIDAVHLATPISMHTPQALELMHAGKHCACAVPAATTLEELEAVVRAQRETGRNYMMMETAVYTREFLYVKELIEKGELGRIQFMRAAHVQDLEGFPAYWQGLPPMHYATHAVGPLFALAQTHASTVHCYGSGTMRPELQEPYGNPYPVETAIFRLEGTAAAAEVTRTMFEVAIAHNESFSVYGDRLSFEWPQVHDEEPVVYSAAPNTPGSTRSINWERVTVPDYSYELPPEIRQAAARFRRGGEIVDWVLPHYIGGLVHEFVSSITQSRLPYPDAVVSAQWTAAGICAHESAINAGAAIPVPSFI